MANPSVDSRTYAREISGRVFVSRCLLTAREEMLDRKGPMFCVEREGHVLCACSRPMPRLYVQWRRDSGAVNTCLEKGPLAMPLAISGASFARQLFLPCQHSRMSNLLDHARAKLNLATLNSKNGGTLCYCVVVQCCTNDVTFIAKWVEEQSEERPITNYICHDVGCDSLSQFHITPCCLLLYVLYRAGDFTSGCTLEAQVNHFTQKVPALLEARYFVVALWNTSTSSLIPCTLLQVVQRGVGSLDEKTSFPAESTLKIACLPPGK